jgi:hypothetical protein
MISSSIILDMSILDKYIFCKRKHTLDSMSAETHNLQMISLVMVR